MKLTTYTITLTLLGLVSLFQVTAVSEIAAQTCSWTIMPLDSISRDYLALEHHHFRAHPYQNHPLIVAGTDGDGLCRPSYPPRCPNYSPDRIWIVTCDWWVAYPCNWQITDHDIDRIVSATNFDGNADGTPDWIQFDFNADGYCNLSDLTWFAEGFGTEQDLSDFSAMGSIYNTRRNDDVYYERRAD